MLWSEQYCFELPDVLVNRHLRGAMQFVYTVAPKGISYSNTLEESCYLAGLHVHINVAESRF